MVSLSLSQTSSTNDGLRPVNLHTDLAPLADLIELAFADSMDSSGRAAVREMRTLSRLRPEFQTLLGVNELVQGISLGYVWVKNGRIVGNVSIYPADIPARLGKTWIIANVAVHPDYRGQGIATQMMRVSLQEIHRQNARAILQVDAHNNVARRLYERLGFERERQWTHWRRRAALRVPPATSSQSFYITRRRDDEWRAEYALAERVRPDKLGGIGWQRPLYPGLFRPSLLKRLKNLLSMRSIERLIVRSDTQTEIHASLWIETAFAASTVQLTLMADPEYAGLYDDALINLAIRRFGTRNPLQIEHPDDDEWANALFLRLGFQKQRTLLHMRCDARP